MTDSEREDVVSQDLGNTQEWVLPMREGLEWRHAKDSFI